MTEVIGTQRGVVVQPSVHGLDNSATLDAISKSGARFRGVARIDDKTPKSELQKLHEGGVRGVRFNLLDRPRGNVKLDVLDRGVEHILEFGWSVDLHIDPKNLLGRKTVFSYAKPGGYRPYRADHSYRRTRPAGFPTAFGSIERRARLGEVSGATRSAYKVHLDFGLPFVEVIPFARGRSPPCLTEPSGTDRPLSSIFSRPDIRLTTAI